MILKSFVSYHNNKNLNHVTQNLNVRLLTILVIYSRLKKIKIYAEKSEIILYG